MCWIDIVMTSTCYYSWQPKAKIECYRHCSKIMLRIYGMLLAVAVGRVGNSASGIC